MLFVVDLERMVGDRLDLSLPSSVLEGDVPLVEPPLLFPAGNLVPPFEDHAVLRLFGDGLPVSGTKEVIQRTMKAKRPGAQIVPASKKDNDSEDYKDYREFVAMRLSVWYIRSLLSLFIIRVTSTATSTT